MTVLCKYKAYMNHVLSTTAPCTLVTSLFLFEGGAGVTEGSGDSLAGDIVVSITHPVVVALERCVFTAEYFFLMLSKNTVQQNDLSSKLSKAT